MTAVAPMGFEEWRGLSAAAAAELIVRRVASLRPGQKQALFAVLPDRAELENALSLAAEGPLHGIPCAVKDLFDVRGMPTAAGSAFLARIRPVPPVESAFVRAVRSVGLAPVAKTNLFEFAWGLTGENAHFGDCEHPHFPGRTSGGSSSGSAAAVAAGIVPFALGTDTAGSIRVPAAFCGLYGYRGTPQEAWISDAFPLAPGFDTAGWFTRTTADMAAAHLALGGLYPARRTLRGCYLELPGLDPEISDAFRKAASAICSEAPEKLRGEMLGLFAGSAELYSAMGPWKSWAIHRKWADAHWNEYGPELRKRLEFAQTIKESDAERAMTGIQRIRSGWEDYFRDHDYLILPATPCVAPTKEESTPALRTRMLSLTAPVSLGGLPVLTTPVFLPSGLSTGLQIVVPSRESPVLEWILSRN